MTGTESLRESHKPLMVRVRDDARSQWAGFTLKVVRCQPRGVASHRVDYLVVMPDGSRNGWYSEDEVEVVRVA